MHQYATLEDTVYFGFGANLTTGAAGDGTTPLYDVRLAGAAASAIPTLSGTPTLLTHANYTDGCYEVAIAATAANGFAAGNTYLVFVTLTISAVTPAACIGSFKLAPVPANNTQWLGTASPALVGGRLDASVGAMAANVITDAATAADMTAVIADAVWNAATATYGAAGSYGLLTETNLDAAISTRASQTSLNTVDDFIDTEIADIQARLPAALVGGRMDSSTGAMAANVLTDAATAADMTAVIADAVWNAATVTYGTAGSYGLLTETNLDAAVSSRSTFAGGAVASVTGSVGSVVGLTPGNLDVAVSTLATAASLAIVDDFIDTEVAAIKAKTDNLPASFPANFAAQIISAGGVADANIAAITGDAGAATKLERVLSGNTTGTVGAASTTTSIVTSALNPAANVADQYKGLILKFDDATTTVALRGQGTDITASTAGGVLTVTALTTAPVSGDIFTVS